MTDFIDNTEYIKFLEKEVVRLTMENNRKLDSSPPRIEYQSVAHLHPPSTYNLTRKASIHFSEDKQTCKDAVILSWGDFSKTLYMENYFKYSMDAMMELCHKFFYDLARAKIRELEKTQSKEDRC